MSEPNIRYLVCKMLTWDKIHVTLDNGQTQRLERPEGEGVCGFIPVYDDREVAVAEAGDHDIIALIVTPTGAFNKGGPDDSDDETG